MDSWSLNNGQIFFAFMAEVAQTCLKVLRSAGQATLSLDVHAGSQATLSG